MGEADFRAWEGWVHSRARTLVLGMQACRSPLCMLTKKDSGKSFC